MDTTPRRSTVTTIIPLQRAVTPRFGQAQCTHLTVTRLYTKEFRCSVCFREGPAGWLWRCTQDRELLLEEDMDRGFEEKLDDLCNIFPQPTSPRKRGPAARLSKLSFLEEVSDNDLKGYSAGQLSQILSQRAKVLDLASEDAVPDHEQFFTPVANRGSSTANSTLSSSGSPAKASKKPWLPLKEGECQFKSCQSCRPSLLDRSYLSLDGIVNGDIPASAVTGFGFHLQKKRPVALVKHVQNLGLRPNPPPQPKASSPKQRRLYLANPSTPRRTAPLGLGLITTESTHQTPNDPFLSGDGTSALGNSDAYDPAVRQAFQAMTLQGRRALTRKNSSGRGSFEIECLTPLPIQTSEELALISAPLTPMERDELWGSFGREPLDVENGVALTEEGVELHVADVITQF